MLISKCGHGRPVKVALVQQSMVVGSSGFIGRTIVDQLVSEIGGRDSALIETTMDCVDKIAEIWNVKHLECVYIATGHADTSSYGLPEGRTDSDIITRIIQIVGAKFTVSTWLLVSTAAINFTLNDKANGSRSDIAYENYACLKQNLEKVFEGHVRSIENGVCKIARLSNCFGLHDRSNNRLLPHVATSLRNKVQIAIKNRKDSSVNLICAVEACKILIEISSLSNTRDATFHIIFCERSISMGALERLVRDKIDKSINFSFGSSFSGEATVHSVHDEMLHLCDFEKTKQAMVRYLTSVTELS